MMGILLALQVNNWNDQRLDRKNEHEILKALKVAFDANLNELQWAMDQHKSNCLQMHQVQLISESKIFEDACLDSLFHGMIKRFTFTDRPGTSLSLINTGNLSLISNNELRDLITQ